MFLDTLDRSILQEMSIGVSSYDALAQKLDVTRSTIYRRVHRLERDKIIIHQTRVSVNFAKLDLITLLIGINVSNANTQKVIDVLRSCPSVKMILQSFGTYTLFAFIFCEKGDEGNKIFEIRKMLEEIQIASFDTSIGFKWQKMEMTPFSECAKPKVLAELGLSDQLVTIPKKNEYTIGLSQEPKCVSKAAD